MYKRDFPRLSARPPQLVSRNSSYLQELWFHTLTHNLPHRTRDPHFTISFLRRPQTPPPPTPQLGIEIIEPEILNFTVSFLRRLQTPLPHHN